MKSFQQTGLAEILPGKNPLLRPIPLHIAGVSLSPFFLAIPTLLPVARISRELIPVIVGAASTLALLGAANTLGWVITGRSEFLVAVRARRLCHAQS